MMASNNSTFFQTLFSLIAINVTYVFLGLIITAGAARLVRRKIFLPALFAHNGRTKNRPLNKLLKI